MLTNLVSDSVYNSPVVKIVCKIAEGQSSKPHVGGSWTSNLCAMALIISNVQFSKERVLLLFLAILCDFAHCLSISIYLWPGNKEKKNQYIESYTMAEMRRQHNIKPCSQRQHSELKRLMLGQDISVYCTLAIGILSSLSLTRSQRKSRVM